MTNDAGRVHLSAPEKEEEVYFDYVESVTEQKPLSASILEYDFSEAPEEILSLNSKQNEETESAAIEPASQELPVIEEEKTDRASVIPVSEKDKWELKRAYTISIPSVGIRAPVYIPSLRFWDSENWDLLEEQMQNGLNIGTVAYPHSVAAASKGNLIIAGHSSPPNEEARKSEFGSVFARLPELKTGDVVSVLKGGTYSDYEVTDTRVISPKNTDILLQQDEESIIKLITCYPVGTTADRWLVTGKLIRSGSSRKTASVQ